tara:strand:+ start:55 stop:303 length:249 start_codon:yes stop_codon:yes gene_type:complete
MKIIVQAEQKLYMDVEVELPDDLIKNINEVPNMTNVNISDWLDQNYLNLEWSEYDSDLNWVKWTEVTEQDQVVNQIWKDTTG